MSRSNQPVDGLGDSQMLCNIGANSGALMREYEAVVSRVAADNPAKVLDWGCGFGVLTDKLQRAGLTVSAFDYRPDIDRPRVCQLVDYPGLEAYISNDPIRLPYQDAEFEAVISMGTLEHVSHPDESLQELRRVMKAGGTLHVYKLPNQRSYVEYLAKRAGKYYHGKLEHDRVYNLASAKVLLERNGFVVESARLTNMLPLTRLGLIGGRRWSGVVWRVNRALSAVPGLRLVATNVEVVARIPY